MVTVYHATYKIKGQIITDSDTSYNRLVAKLHKVILKQDTTISIKFSIEQINRGWLK